MCKTILLYRHKHVYYYDYYAPMLSNLDELHNFLDTCQMGTPLRGCKAQGIRIYVLWVTSHRVVCKMVDRLINCSIETLHFTETLKTKENVAIDLANLLKYLARKSERE
jgi:hypothetical protein